MISIYKDHETGTWHWQSSLLERSKPFAEFNHALNDIGIELRAGNLNPEAEAALEAEADQQAQEVIEFAEQTLKDLDQLMTLWGEGAAVHA